MEEYQIRDLEHARAMLLCEGSDYTCVLCRGDQVYTSRKRGISPMVDFLDGGAELSGFCAADRIVGRAVAMLFCLAGVRAVYAEVITTGAIDILRGQGIAVTWREETDTIINRTGDGPCPMENAVREITDPHLAYRAIKHTLTILTKK